MTELQDLKQQKRELQRRMRESGIRRTSFMNGGLSPEEYRANAEMFRLETSIKSLERRDA